MIEFLPTKQMKALKEQSTHSEKRGEFTAVLEVEPKSFIADTTIFHPDNGKMLYSVQGIIDQQELIVSFAINIPRGKDQGIYHVGPNPLNKETAYAVMLSATPYSIKFYTGYSGFVKFNYSLSERRIKGDFEFICLQNKLFKGHFDLFEAPEIARDRTEQLGQSDA
jgi:hypothetical protein